MEGTEVRLQELPIRSPWQKEGRKKRGRNFKEMKPGAPKDNYRIIQKGEQYEKQLRPV